MILISHRGNISGRIVDLENKPEYIENTLSLGFDVEVDLRIHNQNFYLGHDEPQYEISLEWLCQRNSKLWIHCKDIQSLLKIRDKPLHFFWHEEDTITLTSKNYIWAYPGKQPIKGSIAVMPEIYNDNLDHCIGICSDFIETIKQNSI